MVLTPTAVAQENKSYNLLICKQFLVEFNEIFTYRDGLLLLMNYWVPLATKLVHQEA